MALPENKHLSKAETLVSRPDGEHLPVMRFRFIGITAKAYGEDMQKTKNKTKENTQQQQQQLQIKCLPSNEQAYQWGGQFCLCALRAEDNLPILADWLG